MPSNARYELVRKIADGGMAAIYLGIQHGAATFERPVVIKAIRPDRVADPTFRNALIDEAQIGMALNHSNIVQVLDLGEAGGRYFLILELVDGWDLDQVLRRSSAAGFPLPVPLALHITAEVCRALGYAHAKTKRGKPLNIVHRDVSPHNVLLSEHGEVKLTDFGIATAAERIERTKTGLIKGKVGFMSPEQAEGETLGPASDLFSLGALLYLMVTGKRPFAAATELETLLRTQEARYPPPREVRSDLPEEVEILIKRALQKNPKSRFESAEQMLEAVEKVERGLQPAGATELRRWLGDLSTRDHDVPVTKLTTPPMEVSDDDIVRDIVTQSGLVLSEVIPVSVSGVSSIPQSPPPPLPRARSQRTTVTFAALAAGMALVASWFWNWQMAPTPTHALAIAPASLSAPAVAPLPASVDAGSDAGPPALAPAAAITQAVVDAGPNAAALPADHASVVARPTPAEKPAASAEKPLADGEDPVVSINVTSSPPGALVEVENRPFGPTPLKIRVRSGLAYDVSFSLAGYQAAKQHLFVGRRKNQALSVTLKRK